MKKKRSGRETVDGRTYWHVPRKPKPTLHLDIHFVNRPRHFGDNTATGLVSKSGYFRVFIHWMDEPDGYVWSVDDGNQRTEDVFKGVEFRGVDVVSSYVPVLPDQSKTWEPRLWMMVKGAVLDIADGVAVFRKAGV